MFRGRGDADAPGGIGKAALAVIVLHDRDRDEVEVQLGIAFADEVHMRERVDHHPDPVVHEFLDLFLFGLGGDARRDGARVIERFDEGEHVHHRFALEGGLAVRHHRLTRCPDPRHHVVLDTGRRLHRQR